MLGTLSRPAPETDTIRKLVRQIQRHHTHPHIWSYFLQFHFMDFIVKMLKVSRHDHMSQHLPQHKCFSVNKFHTWFILLGCYPEWLGYWFPMFWRCLLTSHTRAEEPQRTEGAMFLPDPGNQCSVTQPSNPNDLTCWHQHFRNLKSSKVCVHSTQMFGKVSETQ